MPSLIATLINSSDNHLLKAEYVAYLPTQRSPSEHRGTDSRQGHSPENVAETGLQPFDSVPQAET